MLDHTSFIDGFIDTTKVLIEQKGSDKDLNKAIKQSDVTFLTPFQQAKRYSANLPYSKRPRWIVTCNFKLSYGNLINQSPRSPAIYANSTPQLSEKDQFFGKILALKKVSKKRRNSLRL